MTYAPERFRWIDVGDPDWAATIAGITGSVSEDEVLAAHDADPLTRKFDIAADLWEQDATGEGNQFVQVWSERGRIVTVEQNGWQGLEPDVARALSRGGRYAAFYFSVVGERFIYAEDGEVAVHHLDAVSDWEEGPSALPESFGLPDFPAVAASQPIDLAGNLRAIGLALVAHLTGVAFADGSALWEEARPIYRRRAE